MIERPEPTGEEDRAQGHGIGEAPPKPYNPRLTIRTAIMEAERLNSIANRLADLDRRQAELRRYL